MTGLIASQVAGAALKRLLGPVLIGGAILAAVGYHAWTMHSMKAEVSDAQKAEAMAERDAAKAKTALAQEHSIRVQIEANRDALASALEQQNNEVKNLAKHAEAGQAEANTRALEALHAGDKIRRQIMTDPGVGPDAMNKWFMETFP